MKWIEKIKNNFFWLPALLMVADAVSKFLFPEFWTAEFQDRIIWIGIVELCSALIFLVPATMRIGFFLVCCYWGGTIGANINKLSISILPFISLSLFFVAMHWNDASFFCKNSNNYNDEEI